ncbi:CheR family methyltransferase [Pseudobacteroides cellulosolvens]|uniref:protein-glutamate O-methyltransferase n=1 Tax=Pseudobacteroides cellulosolvens ATCC 35603 = DSM 2933 TaxID=398512 RepID=A0A0L6JNA4_9FIRM|nr:protein-glutamate O-methyltransferase CheR [Pseudobacteroides cellulosolvens]KNY27291.1 MCP methyltransferase, CheR-type [Pseudobacteroides cellulosolvens ATCC 35603 = DSM 2933]
MEVDILKSITDKEFLLITDFLKKNYGVRIGPEKKSLVVSRLGSLLKDKGFERFSQLYDYVITDKTGEALVNLVDKLTTNHTFFMRENDHFKFFGDVVLPWMEQYIKDRDLRVWSAGCSTGEEPYTLSMIMNDYFESKNAQWNTKLLATDISTTVLNKAKTGVYLNEQMESLPTTWKVKYFNKLNGENYEIKSLIKDNVIFRRFNLMENVFPFKKKFHVIFCRNVMIYFDEETKRTLINKFYDMTEPGGYLFIGHSESIGREQSRYKYIMPAVYRK